MNTQHIKFLFIAFLLPMLFLNCDDLISDFEDTEYEMSETDQEGVVLLKDTMFVSKPSAVMSAWDYTYTSTFSIDETISNYFELVYDTTFATHPPDSVTAIDTLYRFAFDGDFSFKDTTEFTLSNGDNITLYFDTSFTFIDTVRGTAETYQYTMDVPLSRTYQLEYFLTRFSTSERDTLPMGSIPTILDSLEADSAFIRSDTSQLRIQGATGNNYLSLDFSSYGAETVFFMKDYLDLSIVSEAGDTLAPASTAIPVETGANYFEVITGQGGAVEEIIPQLKTRYAYNLTSGRYLLQIGTTEQTESNTFQLAIVNK